MRRFPLLLVASLFLCASSAFASVIQVAAGDVTVNDTSNCSLIDAINAANASTTTNTTVGACAPVGTPNGGGVAFGVTYTSGNIITLAAGSYTLTTPYTPPSPYPNAVQFTAADGYWYGPDGLPPIATNIVIVGNSAGSTIERSAAVGTPAFRLFYVGGGKPLASYNPPPGLTKLPGRGSLTLVNLTLANGLAKGGDGGGSGPGYGGGGLGAGGAIYNQGALSLIGDTLSANTAAGGSGGSNYSAFSVGAGGGMDAAGQNGSNPVGGIGSGFNSTPGGLWPGSQAAIGEFGNGGGSGSSGSSGNGGNGGVGGGGGGGFAGGDGGFGGGGGGSNGADVTAGGGNGGFGGGGGGGIFASNGGFGGGGGYAGGGGGAGLGGAIFNEAGKVSVLNSTLTGNSAQGGEAGGPGLPSPSTGTVGGAGYGGAIFNLNGTVSVNFSTLAANLSVPGAASSGTAGTAAGDAVYNLYLDTPGSPAADAGTAARMTVTSSILGGPLSGSSTISDCENNAGTFTSGYDLVQTPGSSCTFSNNDQTGNPGLWALAAHGGPTETMALAAASLAIEHGNPAGAPVTDQRGAPRDNLPDVGAFEYNAGVGITPPGNVTAAVGQTVPIQNFILSDVFGSAINLTVSSNNAMLLLASGIAVSSGCGSDSSRYNCTLTLTPAANQTGSTVVTLFATDAYSNTAQASFVLTINPPPAAPVANNLSYTAYAGQALNGQLSGNSSDGGTMSYSVATQPSHGTLKVTGATGAFTYTPTAGYAGSDSFTYTVTDSLSKLSSSAATVSITINAVPVQYAPPVASNETLTAYTSQTLNGQLSAVASNGHALTYAVVTKAAHGSVTLTASSGAFTYTPTSGYTGSDKFTFKVNDGTQDSNAATVTITVNAVPTAPAPPPSSSGGGGGGFGLLSLLLFAPLTRLRKRSR